MIKVLFYKKKYRTEYGTDNWIYNRVSIFVRVKEKLSMYKKIVVIFVTLFLLCSLMREKLIPSYSSKQVSVALEWQ